MAEAASRAPAAGPEGPGSGRQSRATSREPSKTSLAEPASPVPRSRGPGEYLSGASLGDKKPGAGTLSSSISTTATLTGSATLSATANSADASSVTSFGNTPQTSWIPKWEASTPRSTRKKIPIQLQATQPEPQYVALADRLQAGGEAALRAACRSQCFREAMSLQGLEQEDFLDAAGLSRDRRCRLLALVLQQQDRLLVEEPAPETPRCSARGAQVLHRQLRERTETSVERAWQTMLHHKEVGERHAGELRAHRSRQAERAEAQEMRAQRVKARDGELSARRREREAVRSSKWQDAINLAAELESTRRQNLEDHFAVLDERCRQSLVQRDQKRDAMCQQLRAHFQKVNDTAEWKRRDVDLKAWEKAEWLQQMMKKSSQHQEACRVAYEQRLEERHQTVREREHEVLRVSRMSSYFREQRMRETEEDTALFQECMRMRDAIPARIAARLAEASNLS